MQLSWLRNRAEDRASGQLVLMGSLWLLFAVVLLLYQLLNPPAVSIEWDTATEVDTAGFFLYRSSHSPDNGFVAVNDQLIASQGDAVTGASYTYLDQDVKPGQTYYYVLEEVENDSSRRRYDEDMFSYKVPHTWWMVVTSAASLLIGLALLISGLREGRN